MGWMFLTGDCSYNEEARESCSNYVRVINVLLMLFSVREQKMEDG
jgi:hypothetical protein